MVHGEVVYKKSRLYTAGVNKTEEHIVYGEPFRYRYDPVPGVHVSHYGRGRQPKLIFTTLKSHYKDEEYSFKYKVSEQILKDILADDGRISYVRYSRPISWKIRKKRKQWM